jgi:hypothetical protein
MAVFWGKVMMENSMNGSNYPASVVKIIDEFNVVINRGSDHGVVQGDEFVIYYEEQEDLLDPVTGESLGRLEIVRGTGFATHVQPKMTTIKSNTMGQGDVWSKEGLGIGGSLLGDFSSNPDTFGKEFETLPFDNVMVKDQVKPR